MPLVAACTGPSHHPCAILFDPARCWGILTWLLHSATPAYEVLSQVAGRLLAALWAWCWGRLAPAIATDQGGAPQTARLAEPFVYLLEP